MDEFAGEINLIYRPLTRKKYLQYVGYTSYSSCCKVGGIYRGMVLYWVLTKGKIYGTIYSVSGFYGTISSVREVFLCIWWMSDMF